MRDRDATRARELRCILIVKDLAVERAFYEKIFAWPIVDDWGGGVMYDTGAATFELIADPQAEAPNGSSRIAIAVADVRALFEQLKDNVNLAFPLRDNSWGDTSFRLYDPAGFPITVFTPTKPEKAKVS